MEFVIPRDEENKLLFKLKERTDTEAKRMQKYFEMPDLSRTTGSPLFELVERIKDVPVQKDFDVINIPEIVPASISFDLFNFAPDHPNRSKSDTYYVDDKNILRTHDTVFWYYYLNLPEIKARIANHESIGTLCYGKVYRKDEIDRHHMNIFHQMGGWYLKPDSEGTLGLDDLKNVLSEIVKTVFGQDTIYRFNEDVFPYTDPSLEVEIQVEGEWVEVLGGGMPKKEVLANMGVTGYNGWAYGFGLERLAIISMRLPDIRLLWSDDERVKKQLVLGKPFAEVSKYPPVVRDISFVVQNNFIPNDYFDLVRDVAGDLAEEVELIDKYEDEAKFGKDKVSYAYRITYRSVDGTLTSEEIDKLHKSLEEKTASVFGATVR
ncbi:MAG: hypothetical protein A3C03_00490 [Candidatus Colwellbacteria bacterium RIFCSPHIGHO2_02_FULL_45_17]|nr:phenylalanine-trna synthetase-like protein, phenylalanyl-tRNA synthetase alpha chain [uncultured Parcubacteria bacterium Rifle_16ft_4_minimus_37647]OGY58111.1 MAG: hypothetical protein A3C03_00490 [Candidatus Colwellbacteria bacterium RIFCSPHIGHO2_02_FULL_45_17]OGY62307.1 MAG: hypothetical protein A3G58_00510 [Candidatus Colwellbacteria bacterium RIFCSPLOWO2_12_FULL_46_17]